METINKMTNKTQEAIEHLKGLGYNTESLWHVWDVTERFNCTEQQAHEVLNKALANQWLTEQTHFIIGKTAEAMGLGEKEDKE